MGESSEHALCLRWEKGGEWAELDVDLRGLGGRITCSGEPAAIPIVAPAERAQVSQQV